MLPSLLAKAKKVDSRVWKWLFAGLVALTLFFTVWYMHRLKKRIAVLESEKALFEERVKDMKRAASSEKNAGMVKALKEEAERLEAGVMERETKLAGLSRDLDAVRDAINDAKTWAELRRLAKGNR